MQNFDLARQGQRAKGAQEGFVSEGGKRRNARYDLAKRWQRLKLHGRVWGSGGTCFAQVLKPSNCTIISTWQGAGNGLQRGASRCAGWFRDRRGQEKGHEATDTARKMAVADAAHLR